MEADPFDELLGLEDQFYQEGFNLGVIDGEKAGRVEGRSFGLERGFEKFVEAGKLHGRSLIWASRHPGLNVDSGSATKTIARGATDSEEEPLMSSATSKSGVTLKLPEMAPNSRLEKHVKVLYALTEPVSLSTENTEEAVSDFDDRLKRSHGKVKIIERLTGENGYLADGVGGGSGGQQSAGNSTEGNIEDVSILKARH